MAAVPQGGLVLVDDVLATPLAPQVRTRASKVAGEVETKTGEGESPIMSRLGFWVLGFWVAGVVVLAARHAGNVRRLSGIIGRSECVPDEVVAEWSALDPSQFLRKIKDRPHRVGR